VLATLIVRDLLHARLRYSLPLRHRQTRLQQIFYGLNTRLVSGPKFYRSITLCYTSGGFRGGRAGSAPPPWRRTDAVTVLLISDNGTVLWRRLSMIVTSGFLAALECTKFVFGRGSRTPLGELTALFQTPWLKGDPTSKGRGRPP